MHDKRLYHKLLCINVFLAALSGIALAAAFPRPAIYPLGWFALIPLLVAIRRTRPGGSFLLGMLTGTIFFACLLYWIKLFGVLPWILLSIFQALFIALFAFLANRIYARGRFAVLIIPAIWTTIEWIRSLGMFGLTWGDIAYSQARWPAIIQIASVTGPWGISFLVILLNAAIAGFLMDHTRRSKLTLALAASAVLVTAVGGSICIREASHTPANIKIAMVQGGVALTWPTPDIDEKIIRAYWPMTESIRGGVDYIIWPESAMPGDILASPLLAQEMGLFAKDHNAYLLAGGFHSVADPKAAGGVREYNGAYLINPEGNIAGRYDKVRLVPFGEFVPGRDWLPFLDRFPINEIDRYPGRGFCPLHSAKGDLGVMICFESTFPDIGRKLTHNGAKILFVITNDSWFGKTAAVEQHHDFSILRAVENRRYVARNATTGISCLITPWGKVLNRAELGEKTVVRAQAAMMDGQTPYSKYGDWFVATCAALGALALVGASSRRKKTAEHPR